MAKLRVGIIGGGGIARIHLPRLRERADAVELTALADVSPAAEGLAREFGIPRFTADYRELLPRVDAVLICVPTHLHAEIAVAALRAGKAAFCEKPLARTTAQAEVIAAAVEQTGQPFQVGFVRRFDRQWLALRDAVQQHKIGSPVVWRDFQYSPGLSARWFCVEEQGGGPLLDGCVHNYDFALHTFGPAEWVFAHLRTIHPQNTALDTGTATIRFTSGDELVLAWSWGLPDQTGHFRRLDLIGPQGTIAFPEHDLVIHRGGETETVRVAKDSLTAGFADQMDEFIEVAQGRRAPRAGIEEGLASLQLGLSVLESGRLGGEKIYLTESA
jgi:myo-inositol 2-dehydrogenase/D-chiro-inositol 1-dehydrogenase